MQAGQTHTGCKQTRGAGMQHQHHRRVDPFHRRAAASGRIGGAMRKLVTGRAGIAPGPAMGHQLWASQRLQALSQSRPDRNTGRRPAQPLDEGTRQSEGKIKGSDPGIGCLQPGIKGLETVEAIETLQAAMQAGRGPWGCGFNCLVDLQHGHRNRLAPARRAGEIDSDQLHGVDPSRACRSARVLA